MGVKALRHAAALAATVAVLLAAALPMPAVAVTKDASPLDQASIQLRPEPGSGPGSPASRRYPEAPSQSALTPSLSAGGAWGWQNPLPGGNPLLAISCPSATNCYSGSSDGRMLFTSNSGVTWTSQATGIITGINSISCASTTNCVAVGDFGAVLYTSNGTSWGKVTANNGAFLGGVSCPSTTICYAVGYAGKVVKSINGGSTWTAPATTGTTSHLFGVSCPSVTECIAVGASEVITATVDGVTWAVQQSPLTSDSLWGVSCSNTAICVAVGDGGVVFSTAGAPGGWFVGGTTNGAALVGISCARGTRCVAAGFDGDAYFVAFEPANAPRIWGHASTAEPGGLYSISCPTVTACFASGDAGTVVTTTNGGTGWTQQSPGVFVEFHGISCANASTCLAVGDQGDVVLTTNGGADWSSQNVAHPAGYYNYLYGVSCPSTTTCFAVGAGLWTTSDGGLTWSSQSATFSGSLRGVSCPSTTVCYAVGDYSGTILATTDGGANWGAQTSGIAGSLMAISCPTTSVCFAVGAGGEIVATTDSGAHWNPQGSNTVPLLGVSCPSSTVCYAVGGTEFVGTGLSVILATTNGGTMWVDETPSGTNPPFNAVSCGSATVCYAAVGRMSGSGGIFATTNGTSWNAQTTATTRNLRGVSCPSTSTCFAAGFFGTIVGTTDGGVTTWPVLAPSGVEGFLNLKAVSCASPTTCFAIVGGSGEILKTTNGGHRWFSTGAPAGSIANAISCPSASVCIAVAGVGQVFATTNGGTTWNLETTGNTQNLVDVSCPTITTCFAVTFGGQATETTDGLSWSPPAQIGTATSASGISCPTTSTCFATDAGTPGQVFKTTNGGTSWGLSFNLSTDPQAGAVGPFVAIDCPSTLTCDAGGTLGLIATTTDGGLNWRTDNVPTAARITGVSCPSDSLCYASADDSTILYSTDFGGIWNVQFGAVSAIYTGISCPSATACFAVGNQGVITATTNGGAAWTRVQPVGTTDSIRGLTCVSYLDCYGVANETILVTHNGGGTWTTSATTVADELLGISCPAANTCYAVGWPGAIYLTVDAGAHWSYQTSPVSGADVSLLGVSCSSLATCVAVGAQGIVLSTSNGTTWGAEASGTTQSLWSVSCPSSYSCVAVGTNGLTTTRSGGSWHTYPSGTTNNLHGVSCPSVTVCYAVGNAGTVLYTKYRGGAWTKQTSGTVQGLYGINCLKTTMCVASGNFGTARVTLDGVHWGGPATPTFNALLAAAFPDINHAWVAGNGGTILANLNLTPACSTATLTANPPSPQNLGATVALTATSTGCSTPRYAFYLRYPTGTWVLKQAFSANPVWNWNTAGYAAGTYLVRVWANQLGDSTATPEVFADQSYTLTLAPKCASASLSPPNPSQPAGSTVALTATSTVCPNPQYEFWVGYPNGTWYLKQGWGNGTFNWNTAGLAPGTYGIHVWANQAGHSTATWEVYGATNVTLTGCTGATIAPPTATDQVGHVFSLVASSTGGCPNPQYEFWVGYPNGTWVLKRAWGGDTFDWNTAGLKPGIYSVHVWANQIGASTATWEANGASTITLTSGACTSATLSHTGPVASVVTFTANGLGCPNPQYEFWIQYPNGTWYLKRAWGGTTFDWNITGAPPGTYHINVWANNIGDPTATWQTYASDSLTLP